MSYTNSAIELFSAKRAFLCSQTIKIYDCYCLSPALLFFSLYIISTIVYFVSFFFFFWFFFSYLVLSLSDLAEPAKEPDRAPGPTRLRRSLEQTADFQQQKFPYHEGKTNIHAEKRTAKRHGFLYISFATRSA